MKYFALLLLLLLSNSILFSQEIKKIKGTWKGTYICSQGETGVILRIKPISENKFEGTFQFYPIRKNTSVLVKKGKFKFTGDYNSEKQIFFNQKEWLKQPENYQMIDFIGHFDGVNTIEGEILTGTCKSIVVRKK